MHCHLNTVTVATQHILTTHTRGLRIGPSHRAGLSADCGCNKTYLVLRSPQRNKTGPQICCHAASESKKSKFSASEKLKRNNDYLAIIVD